MRHLAALVLAAALAAGLGGCATTGSTGPGASGGGEGSLQAAGPTPQDPNPHGVAMAHDGVFGAGAVRDGVPTPEPAAPVEHETRFAGPTPQIPIPVHGGGRPSIGAY